MDDVGSVLPQPIRELRWSPHRWICEPGIDEVAIAADDRVDVLAACEGDEVVVLAVSCHRGRSTGSLTIVACRRMGSTNSRPVRSSTYAANFAASTS
jgi:hypothetical protein